VLEFLCIRRLSQQRFHNPTPRFPPRGPGGPVPAFHRYYQGATTCCRPSTPRLVSFAWRYHAARLGLCSRRVKAQPQRTGSTLYSATPEADWIRWRRQHLPSSWETSIVPMPGSATPVWRLAPHPSGARRMAPVRGTTKAHTWKLSKLIAGPWHSLSTLRRVGYPTAAQDSLPGAG